MRVQMVNPCCWSADLSVEPSQCMVWVSQDMKSLNSTQKCQETITQVVVFNYCIYMVFKLCLILIIFLYILIANNQSICLQRKNLFSPCLVLTPLLARAPVVPHGPLELESIPQDVSSSKVEPGSRESQTVDLSIPFWVD